jgi:hypothetical protein
VLRGRQKRFLGGCLVEPRALLQVRDCVVQPVAVQAVWQVWGGLPQRHQLGRFPAELIVLAAAVAVVAGVGVAVPRLLVVRWRIAPSGSRCCPASSPAPAPPHDCWCGGSGLRAVYPALHVCVCVACCAAAAVLLRAAQQQQPVL